MFLSAYKQFHFAETTLLKVHNNKGMVTALTLLDFSAAFDTIDYSVLLDSLSDWDGISGTALTWIHSFLIHRFQSIKIRKCFSKAVSLFCSVPQGSVLVPLLLTLYTTLVSSLIHSQKLDHQLYADDTEVYLYLQQTLIFPLNNLVTVSVISLAGWQTIHLSSMPTKQILALWVHPNNTANLLISSL